MSSLEQLVRDGILDPDFLQLNSGHRNDNDASVTAPTSVVTTPTSVVTTPTSVAAPSAHPTQGPILADLAYYHNVKYHWLYSSPHYGWWHFSKDDNEQIEIAYTQQQPSCLLNINGQTFTVDFHRMTQKGVGKSRQILRVTSMANIALKGVAGTHMSAFPPLPH